MWPSDDEEEKYYRVDKQLRSNEPWERWRWPSDSEQAHVHGNNGGDVGSDTGVVVFA